ncbi:hypothetical protein ACX12M_17255 [Cellulosimicrobium cellulans]
MSGAREVKVDAAARERRYVRVADPSKLAPLLTLGAMRQLVEKATTLEIPDDVVVYLTHVEQSTQEPEGTFTAGSARVDFTGTWARPKGGDS